MEVGSLSGWAVAVSDTGWTTDELGLDYANMSTESTPYLPFVIAFMSVS